MEDNKSFCNVLKDLRTRGGVTQQELADLTGVTPTGVSYWETGKSIPSYDTLNKIASYFGVTVDYLMGEKNEINMNDRKAIIFRKTEQVPERDQEMLFDLIDKTVDYFIEKKGSENGTDRK